MVFTKKVKLLPYPLLFCCMVNIANATDASSMMAGVEASVNPNYSAISFAALYKNGGCVPAPTCPPNSKPEIVVVPAAVAGTGPGGSGAVSQNASLQGFSSFTLIPISAFTAYARGDSSGNPTTSPYNCYVNMHSAGSAGCSGLPSGEPSGTTYWRACLAVSTNTMNSDVDGGQYTNGGNNYSSLETVTAYQGTILALTRCVPNSGADIPAGSSIGTWNAN